MHVLIIGGGIAGTVAAMALQEAGIEATVFEAHPRTTEEVGSYFTVTANGLEALRAVGALELAVAAGFPTHRNALWSAAGRRLATLSLDSSLPGSAPAHTIRRPRLARVLQDEAMRRGIRIEYGRRLRDTTVTAGGRIVALFEDGGQEQGDVLVGADGVHSRVRQLIDPAAPSPRYVGLTNFGGFTAGGGVGVEPEAWHLIFGRRAFFGYQATPSGDAVWFANVPRPLITPAEREATSHAQWLEELADLFAGDAGPAARLIEAGRLELAADNTHDLEHVPRWQRGPMVIIGDAAHAPSPSSGQGAAMAIEDAVVLARLLRDHSRVAEAFADFERVRRPRVEKIVAYGARGSSSKIPGALGSAMRNLMLRLIFRVMVTEKSLAWMYDYRVGSGATAEGLQQPA